MAKSDPPPKPHGLPKPPGYDYLEIIRFGSAEAQQDAIGALIPYRMLNFTSYCEDEWLVRTPVARKLRELGIPFEWLTEFA